MSARLAARKPLSLSRALIAASILLATLFSGVFGWTLWRVEMTMERISLHRWLDAELARYADEWRRLGARADPPNPLEFDTWHDGEGTFPAWLAPYRTPGFQEHLLEAEDKHFVVAPHPSGSGLLYVVFKDDADDYLDGYESRLHALALAVGLVGMVGLPLASWWSVRRLSRPLRGLIGKARRIGPRDAPVAIDAPYAELRAIERVLAEAQREVVRHVTREREFSRFASHELRTPMTVIRGSAETLARRLANDPVASRALARVEASCDEMETLIETFLMLGREALVDERAAGTNLPRAIEASLARLRAERGERTCPPIETHAPDTLELRAPAVFLRVLLDNLVRNALDHAAGPVVIAVADGELRVANPSDDERERPRGHGYGLAICERICERLGWALRVVERQGSFEVGVRFAAQSAGEVPRRSTGQAACSRQTVSQASPS